MKKFKEELIDGKFVCSECQKCKKLVWPPNDYCNKCFGETRWRTISCIGKLIEFSKTNETIFCMAEFENEIRIMGSLESNVAPVIGQALKLVKCSYDGNENFVFQLK